MSIFKSIDVDQDITGCIADYIIDRGKEGYCNWEKYKSGKLIQYGSATINTKIDNRGFTNSEYNLYNSVMQNITLEIPDLDRGYCNVVCISRTLEHMYRCHLILVLII